MNGAKIVNSNITKNHLNVNGYLSIHAYLIDQLDYLAYLLMLFTSDTI
jgi:hypothetical protein